ncbi:xylulokinase [Streptomyces sp. Amel2xB2]|uniref:FGGY-family carbohydrate kinase n=1 Tax=Streptomyces sp. Amel2xB2 TaxID=1305829 RepID=UPI000DBAD5C3|nr:FGGY-family carbohydrate kinase [Streptomyces sp. Amel2xB2]RAJ66998.1 xylulokinase [Streptomyces sp. Amel2xB2]
MTLLLGIDIGTSSSKGVLTRSDGQLVAQAVREHRTSSPRAGWVEHDAQEVWWRDFTELTAELLARLPPGERLAGVGVSGIGPCLLPAGEDDEPLRPAVLYGVDTRAGDQVAELTARYGQDEIMRRCGSALTSQALGPKFAWVRQREPEVYRRMRRWYMASSYLVRRLTGAYVLDHHSASQCDPLHDLRGGGWIGPWCEEVAPGLEWPQLVAPAQVVGEVTAGASEATGIPAGTPVVAGTIDAWAESAAVGATSPGDVMLMYGTTMFLVDVVGEPVPDVRLWSTAGAYEDTYCLAAGMATSGAITAWLRDLTGAGYDTLTEEAAALPPGAEGLLMLPYFAGERTPVFDPDARGVVAGLTLRHGRGHLYRAALEATAFGVRHNLAAMREAGGDLRRLVAVGGGARDLWTQIVTDVTGLEQSVPRHTIGAAYGDAFLAAVGTGVAAREDIHAWNPVETTVVPDPQRGRIYDELYGHYLALYPATRETAHTLAARQHADSG